MMLLSVQVLCLVPPDLVKLWPSLSIHKKLQVEEINMIEVRNSATFGLDFCLFCLYIVLRLDFYNTNEYIILFHRFYP